MLVTNLIPSRAFHQGEGGSTAPVLEPKVETKITSTVEPKVEPKDVRPISAEYADRLRNEAAAERVKAQAAEAARVELQAKLDKIDEDKLKANGEYEKAAQAAEKRAQAAEQHAEAVKAEADKRYIDAEIKLAAQVAGMVDPADALVFLNRADIKIDGSEVVGIKEAVEALKTSKAHLFKPGGTELVVDKKGNVIPPTTSSKTKAEPLNAKDMTDAQFNDQWDSLGKKVA
jgi:ATPase subunit of ABC transporter with duplicated ATPase domains